MKITLSMDLGQLAEALGTEATRDDARLMRGVLVESGHESTDEISEQEWGNLIDRAFSEWKPVRI